MITKESPEGQFLHVIWRTIIGASSAVSEQYKWMLTGIAAVLAVVIGNLEPIQKVIGHSYLKGAIALLAIAVVLAAIGYMMCEAVKMRAAVNARLEQVLSDPQAGTVLGQIRIEQRALLEEVAKPFFGPLGWLMRRGAEKGAADSLHVDKGSIHLIVWQAYVMWAALAAYAFEIFIIILGIK